MTTAPTQAQIDQVKSNAQNLQDFVNHLHDYLQDVNNEVYLKLSEDPNSDPGQTFVTTIMKGAFGSIGAFGFPGASVIGSFIGAFFASYAGNVPPSLNTTFGDVWGRFSATFLQANDDLSPIITDPAGHWNSTYTDPTTGQMMAVSALGDGTTQMPGNHDDEFQKMTDAAVAAYRVTLTRQTIGARWQVMQDPNSTWTAGTVDDLAKWWPDYLKANPSLYATWTPDEGGSSCCPQPGLDLLEHYLGYGSSWQFGTNAPDDLCNWLFKDDQFGGPNPNQQGFALRKDVFYNWGLNGSLSAEESLQASTLHRPRPEPLAAEWQELFARRPRKELEAMLIEKAWADPYFMHTLLRSPRETIAKFVGIELPADAKIEVIQERPGDYKVVIPWAGAPVPKGDAK